MYICYEHSMYVLHIRIMAMVHIYLYFLLLPQNFFTCFFNSLYDDEFSMVQAEKCKLVKDNSLVAERTFCLTRKLI